ncbi:hypothetical protein [Niabella yanshanensis]|nr:hypothetical protein [Niabella yanshanensis]
MHWSRTIRTVLLFITILVMANVSAQQGKYLLLGTDFQFKGKWFTEPDRETLSGQVLRCIGGSGDDATDALTVIDIKQAGNFTVWVRTPDFDVNPRTRFIQLLVGDITLKKAGGHGQPGYLWEKVGAVTLKNAPSLLRLHNFNYGRCDAILFVQDSSINPNKLNKQTLLSWKVRPEEQLVLSGQQQAVSAPLELHADDKVVATIHNEVLRLQFVRGGAHQKAIACKTEIKKDGKWLQSGSSIEDHKIYLIYDDTAVIGYNKYYPTWDNKKLNAHFLFEGKKYEVRKPGEEFNPFQAGNFSEAIPVSATAIDQQTIEVQYVTRNSSVITGLWSLAAGKKHIDLRLTCKTARPGYYSMGVAAFQAIADAELHNVMMAPMFQYKRISEGPQMMLSSMMQQPLAIVSAKTAQGLVSAYVAADLKSFPKDWGSVDFAPVGFTLKNEQNQLQPVMFSPVFGMKDSRYQQDQLIDRHFVIGITTGDWDSALEEVSNEVFEVKDYRKQQDVSLTDAVFNMIELAKNDSAGGWAPELKGFYDIEGDPKTAPTVVNATPLLNVSLAVLQNDEDLYVSRSLPTIEFTISRSGYRWATDIVPTAFNATRETLKLNPYQSQFTTSYYLGLHRLLGELNPWLSNIALPGDSLRAVKGYSTDFHKWNQALWAYRLTGQKKWLAMAEKDADNFVKQKIYTNTNKLLSHIPFYNASFYAPWWDLLDLYETTKNDKWLKAAGYGAYFTIAGIRSYPKVEDQLQMIHPGGRYDGVTRIWWKGNAPYRLGFPRKDGDVQEKKVSEWVVSPVGLGLEQPSTYFTRVKGQNVHPVFMSSWAPHLLRLYQFTQKPIYEIYARNSVIGRYANYPGYYATGFTDVPMSAAFPYKGPDVSSVYYHHIPAHMAFSLDYLISETIQRSGGNIMFPYSKQEGFVWFNNRVYGGGKGKVFDDEQATLYMQKGLLSVSNPAINYVTATSDRKFWILLSSEAATEQTVNLKWSPKTNAKKSGAALGYQSDGKSTSIDFKDATMTVMLPAKGFKAVAVPLETAVVAKNYPPVKNGMKVIDLGAPWGKVFLFRIRSPFGWDTFYGFAETAPLQNCSVTITCNKKTQQVNQYPYEWSYNKLPMNEPIAVALTFKDDQSRTISKQIVFNESE